MIPNDNHGIQGAFEMMVNFCLQLASGNRLESLKELPTGCRQLAKNKKPGANSQLTKTYY